MRSLGDIALLTKIIEDAGFNVRTDYSGRGMYGAECIGFDYDVSDAEAVAELYENAGDNVAWLSNVMRGSRTDSMGKGSIMYFPTFQTNEEF